MKTLDELNLVGKTVAKVLHSSCGDCGIRLIFTDDCCLDIGYGFMYGESIFEAPNKDKITIDDGNPFR